MIKTLKLIALLLLPVLSFLQLHAQDDNDNDKDKSSKDENIIIHKKGPSKEKLTVVIDGDNITLNGKPLDDFKSDDIDITKQDMDDMDFAFAGGDMPFPPGTPQIHAFGNDMMKKIKTNSAFLGVMTETTEQGAKITEVTKGSSAEKAGLKQGDIITKLGDDKIADPDDLYKTVGKHKPEEKVSVTYLRDGKQATAQVTLGKSDQMKIYSWNSPEGQFDMKDFTPHNFAFSWMMKILLQPKPA
jgi:serine protease Do